MKDAQDIDKSLKCQKDYQQILNKSIILFITMASWSFLFEGQKIFYGGSYKIIWYAVFIFWTPLVITLFKVKFVIICSIILERQVMVNGNLDKLTKAKVACQN